jgi:hypothetical protein
MLEEYLAQGITPSLIILQMCTNDISNSHYAFEVESYLQRPPAPRPYLEGDQVVVRLPRRFGQVIKPLLAYSQGANFLFTSWDNMTIQLALAGKVDSIEHRIQRVGHSDPLFRSATQSAERVLARFRAAAGSIPVIAMLVDDSEPYTRAIRDMAERVGIPLVVPQRISPVGAAGLLYDGAHLNEEGNRIVGQTFVQIAKERNLFSTASKPQNHL